MNRAIRFWVWLQRVSFFLLVASFAACDVRLIDQALGPSLIVPIPNMQVFPNCALNALAKISSIKNIKRDTRGEHIAFEVDSPKLKNRLKGGVTKFPNVNRIDLEVCGSLRDCQVENTEKRFVSELMLELSTGITNGCQ
jgi:hypothetical protein